MKDIQALFRANRSLEEAGPMEAYMKNQFTFFRDKSWKTEEIISRIYKRKWSTNRFTGLCHRLI